MSIDHSRLPYYAVIFTSKLKAESKAYSEMAGKMEALASAQQGYLGFETARGDLGISISYWKDLESIKKWKDHFEHQNAQQLGRETWYSQYHVRICKVEREYDFISSQ